MKRSGRKSLSQTKAPLKEQIKGSKANPKGSASSKSKASKITLSEKIVDILKKKKDKYNKSHTKDVDTNSLKAVMRRGMGAYSTSHRPGMTRQGWGFARVNKFLEKKSGKKVKKAYIQDDDLLKKGGALKPSKNISQIAKEKGVSLLYASTQLRKGMKVESEHSKFKYAQKTIALQHLDENIDYYKKLAKMESSFEKGGDVELLKVGQILHLRRLPIYYRSGDVGQQREVKKKVVEIISKETRFDEDEPNENDRLKTRYDFIANDKKRYDAYFRGDYLFAVSSDNARYEAIYEDGGKMEKGGELNPDDPKLKNTMIHKSGSAGGVLVGKRHSEGGIKAINKSSNSPLEMEGGEVVITRNAVSDDEKREFEGKMMTNREILSKINEEGGGVAFADGGKVEKEADCGCDDTMEDGGDTNSKIYKGFEIGSDGTYKIPNIKNFGIKHHDLPPSEAFKKLYSHKFEDGGELYKDGGLIQIIDKQVPSMVAFENAFKHVNFHSVKNAYKQHLQKMYNVTFTELPHRIQMALLLGNQKLVDKFINE
jgi:hypothetical protein